MKLSPILLSLTLAACSTVPPADDSAVPGNTPQASSVTQASSATQAAAATQAAHATQAVATPLSDLNLVRSEIPLALVSALKAPYAPLAQAGCAELLTAVLALDAVLGADLDTPATSANPGLIERGAGAVGNAATGAIRGAAEGIIPFRSWVRKLTGAERHAREVAAAIAAGTVRRAYLKGVGQASGCEAPAAPRQ